MTEQLTIGVLALQGDVREHQAVLTALGADAPKIRRASELDGLDGIVLPGGESSAIDKLLRVFGLYDPLKDAISAGLPVFGSCAGMVLLARDLHDGIDGQQTLGGIDITVRRNAFGRQVDSAEAVVTWLPDGSELPAMFIRAPWVDRLGDGVEVLAWAPEDETHAVAVRQGNCVATAFHPEIAGDSRVHQYFLDVVRAR